MRFLGQSGTHPDESGATELIMFNHDAVKLSHALKPTENEYFVFVQVGTGDSHMVPRFACEPKPTGSAFSAT